MEELELEDDLDLEMLELALPEREPRVTNAIFVGESANLTADDLGALLVKGKSTKPPGQRLKTLRNTHHQIAQLLADGVPNHEVSAITGMCASRISILKADPTFAELLEHYSLAKRQAYATMHERMAALGMDAVEALHERILDNPDALPAELLLKTIETTADRTGHGKSQTVNHNSISLTAADIARMKAEQKDGQVTKISSESRETVIRQIRSETVVYSDSEKPLQITSTGGGL